MFCSFLVFSEFGKVYAAGANASGQLGIGSQTAFVTTPTLVRISSLLNFLNIL